LPDAELGCERRLGIGSGAGQLFEEPLAFGKVADLTAGWCS
jgi:hypothetical protein